MDSVDNTASSPVSSAYLVSNAPPSSADETDDVEFLRDALR